MTEEVLLEKLNYWIDDIFSIPLELRKIRLSQSNYDLLLPHTKLGKYRGCPVVAEIISDDVARITHTNPQVESLRYSAVSVLLFTADFPLTDG